LLGLIDCGSVLRFTIPVSGNFRVAITNPAMGATVWIAEPFATTAVRVAPWAIGVLGRC
jgi:hypothetical protein